MEISFYFLATLSLKNRNKLKNFLELIFIEENRVAATLTYVFCSDDYLLEINKQYLNHNYYTDIITFNLEEDSLKPIVGEIYISVDTIRDNAKSFKTTISKEIHRVIFHGVLHLCGYKDKSKKDKFAMTKKEDYYLKLYFDVPRAT